MTTEDAFQAALDADPSDHTTRLVFADWLEERGDPRADGYRALGVGRRSPIRQHRDERSPWYYCGVYAAQHHADVIGHSHTIALDWGREYSHPTGEIFRPTRREADDAAALAFGRLPEERRAELLGLATA